MISGRDVRGGFKVLEKGLTKEKPALGGHSFDSAQRFGTGDDRRAPVVIWIT